MNKNNFVHLHLHTDGSLLDGFVQPETYIEYAQKNNMRALAITDHGSLNNSYRFYNECLKHGIKPIIGCEFYTSEKIGQMDKNGKRLDAKKNHIIVLVKNEIGWKNILKLNHLSFSSKNFYYKPTISLNDLIKYHDGLIVTSACAGSIINANIINDNFDEAEYWINTLHNVFGNDFYLEIQLNEIDNQNKINSKLIEYGQKYGIKIVLTNDVHYINREDVEIQDIVLAIAHKTTLSDDSRFQINARNCFFALKEDFLKLNTQFGYNYPENLIEEWLKNTIEISDKIDFKFVKTKNYPSFIITDELKEQYQLDSKDDVIDKNNLLVKLCVKGLEQKIKNNFIPSQQIEEYKNRLKQELHIVKKMGYIDYFLIVWDIVNFAKSKKIRMGVARGSVGGSLIAYLIGITHLDPIKWGTILERFLSVDRFDPPDIDLDFDKNRREEIFEYLKQKYKNIIHVGTTQNFGVKNILRDCARVLNFPKNKLVIIDKICKNLSNFADLNEFKKYIENNPNIKKALPEIKKFENYIKKLYGSVRSISSHASGICVVDKSIDEVIPINKTDNVLVTAYTEGENRELSELGIIKIDVLGLKTVSIIDSTLNLIEQTRGTEEKEKIEEIIYKFDWIDDPSLIKELKFDNSGIFQFDSDSLYNFTKALDPLNFKQLIDATALFRPDILSSGQAQLYIDRKNGKDIPPESLRKNEIIKDITGKTYYTFIYQEQIMYLLNRIFGFTMAEANEARKYISKKKKDLLVKMLNDKIGQMSNNMSFIKDKKELNELLEMMYKFGGYSFNFSHAVAYTLISAQCLYLKKNYTIEFFTSLLNHNVGDEDKIIKIFNSIKKYKIKILPFDINNSKLEFTIESPNQIRAGFSLIKGMSFRAFAEIEKNKNYQPNKKYETFMSFLTSKIDWGFVNKKIMESLITLGSFDCFDTNRNKLLNIYREFINKNKNKKNKNYDNELFKNGENFNLLFKQFESIEDFSLKEKIEFENKYLGFNYWINLFNDYKSYILKLQSKNILTTLDKKQNGKFVFVFLNKIKKVVSKNNRTFFFAELIDFYNNKEEIYITEEKIQTNNIVEKNYYLIDFTSYLDKRNNEEKFMIKTIKQAS